MCTFMSLSFFAFFPPVISVPLFSFLSLAVKLSILLCLFCSPIFLCFSSSQFFYPCQFSVLFFFLRQSSFLSFLFYFSLFLCQSSFLFSGLSLFCSPVFLCFSGILSQLSYTKTNAAVLSARSGRTSPSPVVRGLEDAQPLDEIIDGTDTRGRRLHYRDAVLLQQQQPVQQRPVLVHDGTVLAPRDLEVAAPQYLTTSIPPVSHQVLRGFFVDSNKTPRHADA